jgi:tetratricopeptide (TPR) repeat protein
MVIGELQKMSLGAAVAASISMGSSPGLAASIDPKIESNAGSKFIETLQQTDPRDPQIAFDGDGDNALNVCDYPRAEAVFSSRLAALSSSNSAKGTLHEAGLRAGLFEALLWQGRLNEAAAELKRLTKVLDAQNQSEPAVELLQARVLDDRSWLEQGQGNSDQAAATFSKAIEILKLGGIKNYETWRLVSSLSHLAALKAGSGDYLQASKLLQDALQQAQSSGSKTIAPLNIADTEEALGSILFKMGSADANEHFARALSIKDETGAVVKPYMPKPYWLEPVYRYVEGSPWSATASQDGVIQQTVNLSGASVQCAVVRDKTASSKQTVLRVFVTLINRSNGRVQLMGRKPELVVLTPKVVLATMIEPMKLAEGVEQKAQKKAKWVRFWGQDATQSVTSTYINPPMSPLYGYGYGGFYPPVVSYGGTYPFVSRSGNMTMVTTQVPDYAAQQRALEKARNIEQNGQAYASDIRSQSLGPCTLGPGEKVSGAIFFELPPGTKPSDKAKYILRLPVGDSLFQFRFDSAPQV